MAMSEAEQKAASDRIMTKLGPLTPDEKQTYDMLMRRPEQYRSPKGEGRTCGVCGASFHPTLSPKGEVLATALEKFSDHQAEHNPTPGQWATAHERIQEGKERAKGT